MKKSNDVSSLGITAIVIVGFIMLAIASAYYSNSIQTLSYGDSAYAGSRESVDSTISPSDSSFFDSEEAVNSTVSPSARATIFRVTSTPRATASPLALEPTPTPFDFFNSVTTATPSPTTPPFDLGLPDEGTVNQITPAPTVTQATASNNNQTIIIGAVVGAVVLILLIVGIILMRRNRNEQPPLMPQDGNTPTPPANGPQYPPYINQQ